MLLELLGVRYPVVQAHIGALSLCAGQSVALAKGRRPAAEIVSELVSRLD
jgi:hypothetical protein